MEVAPGDMKGSDANNRNSPGQVCDVGVKRPRADLSMLASLWIRCPRGPCGRTSRSAAPAESGFAHGLDLAFATRSPRHCRECRIRCLVAVGAQPCRTI